MSTFGTAVPRGKEIRRRRRSNVNNRHMCTGGGGRRPSRGGSYRDAFLVVENQDQEEVLGGEENCLFSLRLELDSLTVSHL